MHLNDLRASKVTDGYPRVLWNCVNRYVKSDLESGKSRKAGITLFFAHANGFPKEVCCRSYFSSHLFIFPWQIFEPTLGHLLSSPAARVIDEVWVWESVQHGDAGIINAPSASGLCTSPFHYSPPPIFQNN